MKLPALVLALLLASAAGLPAAEWEPSPRFAQWESAVVGYMSADYAKPVKKGGILFVGSSTILQWKSLATDFWRFPVVNRGINGVEIGALSHYIERLVFVHEPRQIFFRCGASDIAAGREPALVLADFIEFVHKVHSRLPNTRIVWLSLHPCPTLIKQRPQEQQLNWLVAQYCRGKPLLTYVDGEKLTLGKDGEPDLKLFKADKQHLSDAGYKRLADLVRPHLTK